MISPSEVLCLLHCVAGVSPGRSNSDLVTTLAEVTASPHTLKTLKVRLFIATGNCFYICQRH